QEELGPVIDHLKAIDTVDDVDVDQIEKGRAWMVVSAVECGLCSAIKRHDCFLLQAEASREGALLWKLVFTEKRHLQALVFDLKERGIDVKILRISKFAEKEALTERQEQMIKQALALGYYDFPKRIGIRELAAKFDVSTATLSETLRRGQKKILEDYFER
ncbi:MAG: helix-turn-helix domain-containing protein, partial [Thermoplasmata archaeon]|nr:helix-turn-helix domain-containing protein [Thermoplasmata archaeon]